MSDTLNTAPVIILVRPQLGENIGMAARAMANFGLFDLRLVAPRDGWGEGTPVYQAAVDAAVGAAETVRRATVHPDVPSAAADRHVLFATTARERDQAKPVLSAEAVAAEAHLRIQSDLRVGILFGAERTGLTNDEVNVANAIVSFPVNPEHSSLNLAQSVSLVAYEWFKKVHGGEAPFQLQHVTPPASRKMVFSFFDWLDDELAEANYFLPPNKRPIMSRNLRNIFHRIDLTEADIRTLRGMAQALSKGRRNRPKPSSGA